MSREVITFHNRTGAKLFGIFHPASSDTQDLCVVLLSPGIKNRVAPHRLYVKMGDRLQKAGYHVFRFDPEGLGDSEGSCDTPFIADLYGAIQQGRFVQDTLDAMDWLDKNRKPMRYILGGLCGGAITGLLAGFDQDRVVGLLSIGIPVVVESSDPAQTRFVSDGQWDKTRKMYIAKLFQPRSWLRLLTLRTNFRTMFRSILNPLRRKKSPQPSDSPAGEKSPLNPLFPDAFRRFLEGKRPMLLAFSGADRLQWEFDELFASRNGDLLATYRDYIDHFVIPDANHVLSFEEWQEELFRRVDQWLTKWY